METFSLTDTTDTRERSDFALLMRMGVYKQSLKAAVMAPRYDGTPGNLGMRIEAGLAAGDPFVVELVQHMDNTVEPYTNRQRESFRAHAVKQSLGDELLNELPQHQYGIVDLLIANLAGAALVTDLAANRRQTKPEVNDLTDYEQDQTYKTAALKIQGARQAIQAWPLGQTEAEDAALGDKFILEVAYMLNGLLPPDRRMSDALISELTGIEGASATYPPYDPENQPLFDASLRHINSAFHEGLFSVTSGIDSDRYVGMLAVADTTHASGTLLSAMQQAQAISALGIFGKLDNTMLAQYITDTALIAMNPTPRTGPMTFEYATEVSSHNEWQAGELTASLSTREVRDLGRIVYRTICEGLDIDPERDSAAHTRLVNTLNIGLHLAGDAQLKTDLRNG